MITEIKIVNQQVLHGKPWRQRWLCTIDCLDEKLGVWHKGVGVCCSRLAARIKAGRDLRRKWRAKRREARR